MKIHNKSALRKLCNKITNPEPHTCPRLCLQRQKTGVFLLATIIKMSDFFMNVRMFRILFSFITTFNCKWVIYFMNSRTISDVSSFDQAFILSLKWSALQIKLNPQNLKKQVLANLPFHRVLHRINTLPYTFNTRPYISWSGTIPADAADRLHRTGTSVPGCW